MKRFLTAILLALALSAGAQNLINVQYTFKTQAGNAPLVNDRVVLTPLGKFADYSGNILSQRPTNLWTDTNGSVLFTNVIAGYSYTVEFDTPWGAERRTNGFPSSLTGTVQGQAYNGVWLNQSFAYITPFGTNQVASGNSNVTVTLSGGTYYVSAAGGGAPTGNAGGALTGTYPNPTLDSGSLNALSSGNASPILGTTGTTALAGNTTAAGIGGIAASSGTGTGTTITGGTYSGNAQGGSITNLDSSIHNLNDVAGNIIGILAGLPTTGGNIYIPTGFFQTASVAIAGFNPGFPPYQPGLTIYGLSSALDIIALTTAHTNLFDQYSGIFGTVGINLRGVTLDGSRSTSPSYGYVSSPGASGLPLWNDVEFNNWSQGFVCSAPDADMQHIEFNNVGIGGCLSPFSDVSKISVAHGFGVTNADLEVDSRGDQLFVDASTANIGVLVGGFAADLLMQVTAESLTNCAIAIGYPTNWPYKSTNADGYDTQYAGTTMGNQRNVGPVTAGWGYTIASGIQSSANPFAYTNSAFMKVWDQAGFSGANIIDETINGMPAVISYTPAGDVAHYHFRDVFTNPTNLMIFSTGGGLPPLDGVDVNVNTPEADYTSSNLMYYRDTSGNLIVAGALTNIAGLTAPAGQALIDLNVNGLQVGANDGAVSFNPEVCIFPYPNGTPVPAFGWQCVNNFCGVGPGTTTDNTMRFGPQSFPFSGIFSGWKSFGTVAMPVLFDCTTFSIATQSTAHTLTIGGDIGATALATSATNWGKLTATGFTNTTGSNVWANMICASATFTLTDAGGNAWATNASFTGVYPLLLQAGEKVTASSGITGTWHVHP